MYRRDLDNVILLDMDGTLTLPRKRITWNMTMVLMALCRYANIAIVSGSDIEYIIEQCGEEIIKAGFAAHVVIMPCNGTKIYKFDGEEYKETFSASMIEGLGEELYRKTIKGILRAQAEIIEEYDFEISGNFISYRESTLNWSMIGRGSSQEVRDKFSNLENKDDIRNKAIDIFKNVSLLTDDEFNKIEFALGGQTSIDVYPKGWDKTYSLNHIEGKTAWFVGDKCQPGGNDYHIYEKLDDKALSTSGPEETEAIIDMIIETLVEEKE